MASAHAIEEPGDRPQAVLAPVRPEDRLFSLDVVRGFAVLGILAVNATFFAWPYPVGSNPTLQPDLGTDGWAAWQVMHVFFQDKMRTLFSMLFGISIFLMGGERDDEARSAVLKRRLGWLTLFGLLHGLVFWYGDILLPYAVAGFVVMLVRSWSARRLLVVGVTLNLVCSALYVGLMASLGLAPPETMTEVMAQSGWGLTPEQLAAMIAPFHGDALSVTLHLMTLWVAVVPMMLIFAAPSIAALMMIGMGLFKLGVFAGRSPTWVYLVFIILGGGALWLIHQEASAMMASGYGFLEAMMRPANTFLSPLASLAYASVLILLARFGLKALLHPLASAGRMAFTNYLTQTLIMTTIFYGGRGLGYFGEIGWPQMWLVIGAVWIVQLIWSPLWLSRFTMGPFEWVWRRLTYRRPVSLLRARG
jgi:uncharacterized protein